MNQFTKSKKFYKTMQTMYGRLFLCTLVGYTILFIIYLIYAKYTLNHSQKEIKECYVEHM